MIPNTDFSIRRFLGGYDQNFTYLITCSTTRAQVLIDAAIRLDKVLPFIYNQPITLLITHSHSDHTTYLDQYLEAFKQITVIVHPDSSLSIDNNKFRSVNHKQEFKIGKLNFVSIHTPGHYYDSICYQLNPVLFTGDTLFVGRTGRTISPKSNIKDLYDSIYNKILNLPDNIRIYPGHDYGKQSTIQLKENVKASTLLKAKDLNEFIDLMQDYEKNRK